MIFFFFVETKNRTLEELTEIFRSKTPVKTSLKKTKIVTRGQDGVTEVMGDQATKETDV